MHLDGFELKKVDDEFLEELTLEENQLLKEAEMLYEIETELLFLEEDKLLDAMITDDETEEALKDVIEDERVGIID